MAKHITTKSFIQSAKSVHGEKYDYSKVKYVKAIEKVIIVCPKHGEFLQSPNNHLKGSGCPECAVSRQPMTTEEFIEKAKAAHGNLYDYSQSCYVSSTQKISVICSKHGGFDVIPTVHIRGKGCLRCKKENKLNNRLRDFIEKSKEVHEDKYDYRLIDQIGSVNDKVKIICPVHGEYLQSATNHIHGCGCHLCGKTKKLEQEDFVRKSRDVHGDKYDYSLADYVNVKTKVRIICPEHGEFEQLAGSHMGGTGCPSCGIEKLKSTREEFIEKAKAIHGDKYDYRLVDYSHYRVKVKIICHVHGEFEQTPEKHLKNSGCRYCSQPQYQSMNLLESFIGKIGDAKDLCDAGIYYLGGVCRKGHDWHDTGYSLRLNSNNHCLECNQDATKKYYKQHKGKYKEKIRLDRWLENPRISPSVADLVESQVKMRLEQKIKSLIRQPKGAAANIKSDYTMEEKGKVRSKILFHASSTLGMDVRSFRQFILSDGSLTFDFLESLIYRSSQCPYCLDKITALDASLDHIIPLSKGGKHSAQNVVFCCHGCNRRKSSLSYSDWIEKLDSDQAKSAVDLYKSRYGSLPWVNNIPVQQVLPMFGF